jgi:hypothetical protein
MSIWAEAEVAAGFVQAANKQAARPMKEVSFFMMGGVTELSD